MMAEPLKNQYSEEFFDQLAEILSAQLDGFERDSFLKKIFDNEWDERELKERTEHLSNVLHLFLPTGYEESLKILIGIIDAVEKNPISESNLPFLFIPDYIERYGMDHFDASIKAIEVVTPFITCEFTVRPFIVRYQERMMSQMQEWSHHKNHHLRRLASEGCRPRLPWASVIQKFVVDPSPVLPILVALKADPSEYVSRSVANNLNDISKDHPELMLDLCHRWKGETEITDKVIKHACRTLLKGAHPKALSLFDYGDPGNVTISDFRADKSVRIGDKFNYAFTISQTMDEPCKIRVEVGIDYVKSNGKRNRKIFKITEIELDPDKKAPYTRTQSFQDLTTRKHYRGTHSIAVIINGLEMKSADFEVEAV